MHIFLTIMFQIQKYSKMYFNVIKNLDPDHYQNLSYTTFPLINQANEKQTDNFLTIIFKFMSILTCILMFLKSLDPDPYQNLYIAK